MIVNIASMAGQRGSAYHAHYAAAKGGVLAFTRSLAREVIQYGIRVNAVSPGRIETDLLMATSAVDYERWMADTPARRLGTARKWLPRWSFWPRRRRAIVWEKRSPLTAV